MAIEMVNRQMRKTHANARFPAWNMIYSLQEGK